MAMLSAPLTAVMLVAMALATMLSVAPIRVATRPCARRLCSQALTRTSAAMLGRVCVVAAIAAAVGLIMSAMSAMSAVRAAGSARVFRRARLCGPWRRRAVCGRLHLFVRLAGLGAASLAASLRAHIGRRLLLLLLLLLLLVTGVVLPATVYDLGLLAPKVERAVTPELRDLLKEL
jgi:hypothetical protein